MRQLQITVPNENSNDIIRVLQAAGIRSITRLSGDQSSVIIVNATHSVTSLLLYELDKVGCGVAYGRVVLLPLAVVKPLPKKRKVAAGGQDAKRKIAARLAIEEIYNDVEEGSELTADYVYFILVASMIAALGLGTDNTVMIVASMLMSPMMSPILGFTFGSVVHDRDLFMRGLVTEAVGIALAFLVGFVMGLIMAPFSNEYSWPTSEMQSRGEEISLIVGLAFAIPSGAGVALSVTGGGGNSLVGVAIAASLLPPVVNTGICLAYAAVAKSIEESHDPQDFLRIGGLSFTLFLINVAVIYIVAVAVFYGKQIRKVRKQMSRYRELPPVRLASLEDPNNANRKPVGSAAGSGNRTNQVVPSGPDKRNVSVADKSLPAKPPSVSNKSAPLMPNAPRGGADEFGGGKSIGGDKKAEEIKSIDGDKKAEEIKSIDGDKKAEEIKSIDGENKGEEIKSINGENKAEGSKSIGGENKAEDIKSIDGDKKAKRANNTDGDSNIEGSKRECWGAVADGRSNAAATGAASAGDVDIEDPTPHGSLPPEDAPGAESVHTDVTAGDMAGVGGQTEENGREGASEGEEPLTRRLMLSMTALERWAVLRGWLWESLSIARERLRVQEVEEGERDVPVIIEQCLKEVALQKRGERDILEQWVEAVEQALDEDELEQVAEQAEQLAETAMQLDAEGGAPSVSVEEPVEAGEASAMEEAQEVQGEA